MYSNSTIPLGSSLEFFNILVFGEVVYIDSFPGHNNKEWFGGMKLGFFYLCLRFEERLVRESFAERVHPYDFGLVGIFGLYSEYVVSTLMPVNGVNIGLGLSLFVEIYLESQRLVEMEVEVPRQGLIHQFAIVDQRGLQDGLVVLKLRLGEETQAIEPQRRPTSRCQKSSLGIGGKIKSHNLILHFDPHQYSRAQNIPHQNQSRVIPRSHVLS